MIVVYAYVVGDILHKGHLEALRNAKSLGDKLIVGVLTDEAVMENKPEPIIHFEDRFDIIRALAFVDCVVAQKEYSPLENIKTIRPDVLAESDSHCYLGEEYSATLAKLNVRVIAFPYFPEHSSTDIKKRVRSVR